jgi:hypothetical protein
MEGSNKLLCFLCSSSFGQSQLETHVNTCKSKAEKSGNKKIQVPDEYGLLFKTFKGGLELEADDVQNFNYFIQKNYGGGSTVTRTPNSLSKSMKGTGNKSPPKNISKSPMMTSTKKFGQTMGGGGFGSPSRSNGFGGKVSKSPEPSVRQPGMRPRLLMCPLCGREFGSLSLPIHMKTCRQKFEIEQMNLPKNMRRSADKIIEQYEKNNLAIKANGSGGNYNIDQMNEDAFEIFNKEALVPCEVCGRTFLPDRLLVHLKSCKKKVK